MRTAYPPKKTSRIDWHPADIVAALHKRGLTLRKLAEQHGVSPKAVIRALRERCVPSERRIAEAVGVHPMTIWPSRYNADGSRLLVARGQPSHKSRLNSNAASRVVNGNLRRAA